LTDWILRIKGARSNSRFAREVRIAESSVRDLIRYDTLKLFSSETLGRLIEWERRKLTDQLDCQLVELTRGERIVMAYLRSLSMLPKRQYTIKRSKMDVPMTDLIGSDIELGLDSE
jgi:hypothetical protein